MKVKFERFVCENCFKDVEESPCFFNKKKVCKDCFFKMRKQVLINKPKGKKPSWMDELCNI